MFQNHSFAKILCRQSFVLYGNILLHVLICIMDNHFQIMCLHQTGRHTCLKLFASNFVCMHTCVSLCVCMLVCLCVYACLCVFVCMHAYVSLCVCMLVCLCVYACLCVFVCMHTCVSLCVCMLVCLCVSLSVCSGIPGLVYYSMQFP